MSDTERRWSDAASKSLLGKKIIKVGYITPKEADELGWHGRSVAITLDNGVQIFPSTDDEGNGPGALFTTDQDLQTIPVIP